VPSSATSLTTKTFVTVSSTSNSYRAGRVARERGVPGDPPSVRVGHGVTQFIPLRGLTSGFTLESQKHGGCPGSGLWNLGLGIIFPIGLVFSPPF
jgi:hypothetical protein